MLASPQPQTAPALRPTYQPVQLMTGGGGAAGGGALRGRSAARAGPTASAANVTPESNSFFIIQPSFALRRCTPPQDQSDHIRPPIRPATRNTSFLDENSTLLRSVAFSRRDISATSVSLCHSAV